MRTTTSFIILAALFVGQPDLAHSSSIIDQQQTGLDATTGFGAPTDLSYWTYLAQTFTVGISGQLDSISIFAANGGGLPITLNLLQTSGGLPTAHVLPAWPAHHQQEAIGSRLTLSRLGRTLTTQT